MKYLYILIITWVTCAAHDLAPHGQSWAIGTGVAVAFTVGFYYGKESQQ